jgi:hypothetical protein
VVEDFDPRHFDRGRQQIVGQGAVDELALLVERQPLVKGVANPLGDDAVDLAGDNQRIDHSAAIMHHNVFQDAQLHGRRIDFDDHCVCPRRGGAFGRAEIGGRLQPRLGPRLDRAT